MYEANRWGYYKEDGTPDAERFYDDKVATWQEYVKRPNYYGIPRVIRVGVSAQYSF